MKSTMMMKAADLIQRQKINDLTNISRRMSYSVLLRNDEYTQSNYHLKTSQSLYATSFHAAAKKSLLDVKGISPPSSHSSLLYPIGRTRCYTTILLHQPRTSGQTSLWQSNFGIKPLITSLVSTSNLQQQIRLMGSKKDKESKHQKNKAKQKSMIKKQQLQIQQQKATRQQQKLQQQQGGTGDENSLAASSVTAKAKSGAAEQHVEWVEFQKSIEVDGFETGQTLTAIDASKKGRSGGKAATKKRLTKRDEMADKIKERQRLAGGGGGEFPPMRYSDEETERLLKQAYAAIPKRMGRRGTLQLKRQKRRWHLVREIHRKYKQHIMKFHVRRMERRSTKMKQIKDFISNVAPVAVQQDMEYQNVVRQRFINMMETAAALRAEKAAASTTTTSEIPIHLQNETMESNAA